jgi:hypothetical protein
VRLFVSNVWLTAAGVLSVAASLTHLAIIFGLFAMGIAAVLMAWSAYAFSAAGLIRQLPFTRTALVLISSVLILRALAYFVRDSWRPDLSHSFMLWSSLIVFVLGLCFAIGTWQAWPELSQLDVK